MAQPWWAAPIAELMTIISPADYIVNQAPNCTYVRGSSSPDGDPRWAAVTPLGAPFADPDDFAHFVLVVSPARRKMPGLLGPRSAE
jgi:hypothetical protein